MKANIFLALNKNGLVKATKGRSSLARSEIGIMLSLEVPDSAFISPFISASLKVPAHAVEVPEIAVDVVPFVKQNG
ncbi:MAG: hypothetical protein NUV75_00585 [Gallionella sp.]|nr:hypothetical protein [Gallionella sp.]